jgi:hypothetical protein
MHIVRLRTIMVKELERYKAEGADRGFIIGWKKISPAIVIRIFGYIFYGNCFSLQW